LGSKLHVLKLLLNDTPSDANFYTLPMPQNIAKQVFPPLDQIEC